MSTNVLKKLSHGIIFRFQLFCQTVKNKVEFFIYMYIRLSPNLKKLSGQIAHLGTYAVW